MDGLCDQAYYVVMRKSPGLEDHYDIWENELGYKLYRVHTKLHLEPGQWLEVVDGKLRLLAKAPIEARRYRGIRNLFTLKSTVLRPEEEYFELKTTPAIIKEYRSSVGLSPEFGTVYIDKQLRGQMKRGILFNVDLCNYGVSESIKPEILKRMETLGTLWIAVTMSADNKEDGACIAKEDYDYAKKILMERHKYYLAPRITASESEDLEFEIFRLKEKKPKCPSVDDDYDSSDSEVKAILSNDKTMQAGWGRDVSKDEKVEGKSTEFGQVEQEEPAGPPVTFDKFNRSVEKLVENEEIRKAIQAMGYKEQLEVMDKYLKPSQS